MKHTLLLLALLSNFAHADWDDPETPFSTKSNKTESMTIVWRPVDNVQTTCAAEIKKRDGKTLGYTVDACSFWEDAKNKCTIITKKNPTQHDIGHELRHCYQGQWH
jgi:phage/plasmid primase-like uncharacterized protein